MPDYQCDSPRGRWVSEAGIGINLRRIRRAPQLLWESTPKLVLLMICWRSISLMLPVNSAVRSGRTVSKAVSTCPRCRSLNASSIGGNAISVIRETNGSATKI
jgi:hypothetical protein